MRRRTLWILIALVAALTWSGWNWGLQRQPLHTLWTPQAVDPLDAYQELDRHLVTLDFKDVPLSKFAATISQQSGVEIRVHDDLGMGLESLPITIKAKGESLRSVVVRLLKDESLYLTVLDGHFKITDDGQLGQIARAYLQGDDVTGQSSRETLQSTLNVDYFGYLGMGYEFLYSTDPSCFLFSSSLEEQLILQRLIELLRAPPTSFVNGPDLVRLSDLADRDTESRWLQSQVEFSGDELPLEKVLDAIVDASEVQLDRRRLYGNSPHASQLRGVASGADWLCAVLDSDDGWSIVGKTILVGEASSLPTDVRAYRIPDDWAQYVNDDVTTFVTESFDPHRWSLQGGHCDVAAIGGWLVVRGTSDVHYRLEKYLAAASQVPIDGGVRFSPDVTKTWTELCRPVNWSRDKVSPQRMAQDLDDLGIPVVINTSDLRNWGVPLPPTLSFVSGTQPLLHRIQTASADGKPLEWQPRIEMGGILVFSSLDNEIGTTYSFRAPLELKSRDLVFSMIDTMAPSSLDNEVNSLAKVVTGSTKLENIYVADTALRHLAAAPRSELPCVHWLYDQTEAAGEDTVPESVAASALASGVVPVVNVGSVSYSVAMIGVADFLPLESIRQLATLLRDASLGVRVAVVHDMLLCSGEHHAIRHTIALVDRFRAAPSLPDSAFPLQLVLPLNADVRPINVDRPSKTVSSVTRSKSVSMMLEHLSEVMGKKVQGDQEIAQDYMVFGHAVFNVPTWRLEEVVVAPNGAWPDPFVEEPHGVRQLMRATHNRVVLQRDSGLPEVAAAIKWSQPVARMPVSELDSLIYGAFDGASRFGQPLCWTVDYDEALSPWAAAVNMAARKNPRLTVVQTWNGNRILTGSPSQLGVARNAIAILTTGSPLPLSELPGWSHRWPAPLDDVPAIDAIRSLAGAASTPIVIQDADPLWETQVSVSGDQTVGEALQSIADQLDMNLERQGDEAWLGKRDEKHEAEPMDVAVAMKHTGSTISQVVDMVQLSVAPNSWESMQEPPPQYFTPLYRTMPHRGCVLPISESQIMVVHDPNVRREARRCLELAAQAPATDEELTQWLLDQDGIKRGLACWALSQRPATHAIQAAANEVLEKTLENVNDPTAMSQVMSMMLAWKDPQPDHAVCRKLLDKLPLQGESAAGLRLVLIQTREGAEFLGQRLLRDSADSRRDEEERAVILANLADNLKAAEFALPYVLRLGTTSRALVESHAHVFLDNEDLQKRGVAIVRRWSESSVPEDQERAALVRDLIRSRHPGPFGFGRDPFAAPVGEGEGEP